MVAGHGYDMIDAFHRMTGAYGHLNHIRERAAWVITNGTHDIDGNMWQSYPQVVTTSGAPEFEGGTPTMLSVVIVQTAFLLRSGRDYRLSVLPVPLVAKAVGSTSGRLISGIGARRSAS